MGRATASLLLILFDVQGARGQYGATSLGKGSCEKRHKNFGKLSLANCVSSAQRLGSCGDKIMWTSFWYCACCEGNPAKAKSHGTWDLYSIGNRPPNPPNPPPHPPLGFYTEVSPMLHYSKGGSLGWLPSTATVSDCKARCDQLGSRCIAFSYCHGTFGNGACDLRSQVLAPTTTFKDCSVWTKTQLRASAVAAPPPSPPPPSPSPPSPSPPPPSPSPPPPPLDCSKLATDGSVCGDANQGVICRSCCSLQGICGSAVSHCGAGNQLPFSATLFLEAQFGTPQPGGGVINPPGNTAAYTFAELTAGRTNLNSLATPAVWCYMLDASHPTIASQYPCESHFYTEGLAPGGLRLCTMGTDGRCSSGPLLFPGGAWEQCELPAGTLLYSIIVQGDADVAAHAIYGAVAVGGTFRDATSQQSGTIASVSKARSYVGTLARGTWQWKGPITQGPLPWDFSEFEKLARSVVAHGLNGYKVIIYDQGGEYNPMDASCSSRQTGLPGAQGEVNAHLRNCQPSKLPTVKLPASERRTYPHSALKRVCACACAFVCA